MKELTKSVNTLVRVQTEAIANQQHVDQELSRLNTRLDDPDTGIEVRMERQEIAQAEDKTKWSFLIAFVSIVFASGLAYYFTTVKPIQQSNLNSEEIRILIESIEEKL